jgi:phosphorylated CTD-interacting factor 1
VPAPRFHRELQLQTALRALRDRFTALHGALFAGAVYPPKSGFAIWALTMACPGLDYAEDAATGALVRLMQEAMLAVPPADPGDVRLIRTIAEHAGVWEDVALQRALYMDMDLAQDSESGPNRDDARHRARRGEGRAAVFTGAARTRLLELVAPALAEIAGLLQAAWWADIEPLLSESSLQDEPGAVLCREDRAAPGIMMEVRLRGVRATPNPNPATTIRVSHYRKLWLLWLTHNRPSTSENAFLSDLWCMLQRYATFTGGGAAIGGAATARPGGANLHAAVPQRAMDVMAEKLGVTGECFASPLNVYFSWYCSAFPDLDGPFGSRGSFFECGELATRGGMYEANPPFVEEIIDAMAVRILALLDEQPDDVPLGFVVVIPDWEDPVTRAILMLRASPFLRGDATLAAHGHVYVSGVQHVQPDASRMTFEATHATLVLVLQTPSATARWPLSEDAVRAVGEAWFPPPAV